jgi:hypothetical protein
MINYCNIIGGEPNARWRLLHPDNFNGDMTKEEIAGSISVRIWLGRADQMVNYILLLLLLFNDNNNDNDV